MLSFFSETKHNHGYPGRRHKSPHNASNKLRQKQCKINHIISSPNTNSTPQHHYLFQTTEDEFTTSMQTGFNAEQISILWQFVSSKRDMVENILKHYDVQDFRFRELDWRLEARIASRSLLSQSIPIITMKLHLDSETINENKQTIYGVEGEQTAGDAKPTPVRLKREVIVQTDPNNLVYMIDVLEKALEEAKTHRIRNLIKAL